MDPDKLSRLLYPIWVNATGVALVYLFGSQLNKTTGPLSDVDLGILVDPDSDQTMLRATTAHEVGKALGISLVDIGLLRDTAIELSYAIIAGGLCIYQRDVATRVEFEANVMGRYGDYLPVLRAQRENILGGVAHDRRVQRYREAFRRTERTLSEIRAAQG
jgi:predicted nucleotidyltransferase